MTENINTQVLALDSLYGILSWYDRCWLHLKRIDRISEKTSPRTVALCKVIEQTGWEPPERRPGQDRCGQYKNENGEWLEIEDYARNHPELTELIKQSLK